MVYLLGYYGAIWHSARHIRQLLREGYEVLAMDFRDVLKRRDPQDLITTMDEVENASINRKLMKINTFIVGVSMGGFICSNDTNG